MSVTPEPLRDSLNVDAVDSQIETSSTQVRRLYCCFCDDQISSENKRHFVIFPLTDFLVGS